MESILRGMVLLRLTFVRVFWKTFQSNHAEVATHLEAMVEPGGATPVAASPYTYEWDTQRDTGRQRSESSKSAEECRKECWGPSSEIITRGEEFLKITTEGGKRSSRNLNQ